jgi:hypothetical protein
MGVHFELTSSRAGEWYVITEGTYLVGFRGLHAREMAVRQQRELTQLFNATATEPLAHPNEPTSTVKDE